MRLRWAKSISTFLRSLDETLYWGVFLMARATSLAPSCSSQVILRVSAFGQHFIFDGQAWQVCFKAWYLATPLPLGPRLGSECSCQTNENSHQIASAAQIYALNN